MIFNIYLGPFIHISGATMSHLYFLNLLALHDNKIITKDLDIVNVLFKLHPSCLNQEGIKILYYVFIMLI